MKLSSILFLVLIYSTVFADGENRSTAIIRPDIFAVHQDVDFEVIISPNKVLQKGDLITPTRYSNYPDLKNLPETCPLDLSFLSEF